MNLLSFPLPTNELTNEPEAYGRARDVKEYIAREDQEGEEFLSTWLVAINCRNDNSAMHEGSCDRRRPDDLNILFLCRKKEKERWIKRGCSRGAVRSTRRAARRELDTLFVSIDSSDFFFSSSASQTLPRRRNNSS